MWSQNFFRGRTPAPPFFRFAFLAIGLECPCIFLRPLCPTIAPVSLTSFCFSFHENDYTFFLFNIKIYKTRYLRLLDYKLLNYITRTITREARNHDYPKGHLGRNPITFDQIPTVLDYTFEGTVKYDVYYSGSKQIHYRLVEAVEMPRP